MAELEDFCDFLFEKGSGYVYTPNKDKQEIWSSVYFHWPTEKIRLYDYIRVTSSEADVYISPVLHKIKNATKEHISRSNVVWIEFDGRVALDFKGIPEPDWIIQTSTEDNKHCYWKTGSLPAGVAEDINERLTYFLEADGTGWDIGQVLRPPETLNHKPDKSRNGLPTKVLKSSNNLHSVSVFDSAPPVNRTVVSTVLTYETLIEPKDILEKYGFPDELEKKILRENPVSPHRSSFLFHTAHLLADFGLTHLEITSLLYECDHRIKKYVGRKDQLERLSQIASIALLRISNENQVEAFNFFDIIESDDVIEWLLDGLLHTEGLMLLTGLPGTGKTSLASQWITELASGASVLGKMPPTDLLVAFLSLEMSKKEFKYFLDMQSKNWDPLKETLIRKNTVAFFPVEAPFNYIEAVIKAIKPQVLVIDSLSEILIDLVDLKEARAVFKFLDRLRRTYKVAIIIIHHQRKASGENKKPNTLGDLFGSYIIGKVPETVLCLWETKLGVPEFDLFSLKGRFNSKQPMKLKRDESLHYTVESVNISASNSGNARNGNPLFSINQ